MNPITIVMIDDHTQIRETWSMVLKMNPAFQVVGQAASAEEGLEKVETLSPTVAIMDINLPGMNGIEATGVLRARCPATKVLGVSLHTEPAYAKAMLAAGATGYLTKYASPEEMFRAVAEVAKGRRYVCEELEQYIAETDC